MEQLHYIHQRMAAVLQNVSSWHHGPTLHEVPNQHPGPKKTTINRLKVQPGLTSVVVKRHLDVHQCHPLRTFSPTIRVRIVNGLTGGSRRSTVETKPCKTTIMVQQKPPQSSSRNRTHSLWTKQSSSDCVMDVLVGLMGARSKTRIRI